MKKFSFIIPCYNHGSKVGRAIDSILKINCEKEIIVVNDGSTDDSRQILEQRKDIILLNQDNMGVGAARNAGIRKAKYDNIFLLDADDEFLDGASDLIPFIKDYDIVYGNFEVGGAVKVCKINLNRSLFLKNNPICATFLFKKKVWDNINGFIENKEIHEDWNFLAKAFLTNYKFKYVDSVIFKYNISNNGMLRTMNKNEGYHKKLTINSIINFESKLLYKNKKVALLIIATGKYKNFLKDLLSSADEYFLKNHKVTYFLFVDELVDLKSKRNIEQIIIENQKWPLLTLFRYKILTENNNKLKDFDYIYYIDCDMKFVSNVEEEIFSDIVCTAHHAYLGNRGTPENNPKSLAYISNKINFQYKQNAFLGGSKDCVLNMFQFLANQIEIDYKRGIVACWHDESHANKFYIMYATKILSPEYCCNPHIPVKKGFIPKIIHIPKNDNQIRN